MNGLSSSCSDIVITEFTKFASAIVATAATRTATTSRTGIPAHHIGTTSDATAAAAADDDADATLANYLSQLAIRSKGYYPDYDEEFMKQVQKELTYTADDCISNPTFIASIMKTAPSTITSVPPPSPEEEKASTTSPDTLSTMSMEDIVGFYQLSTPSDSDAAATAAAAAEAGSPTTGSTKPEYEILQDGKQQHHDGEDITPSSSGSAAISTDRDGDGNVVEGGGGGAGSSAVELEALFVEPKYIGNSNTNGSSGSLRVGSKLFQHAIEYSHDVLHAATLIVQSDPYAEQFYIKQGCINVGYKESDSISNRYLPLLHYKLQ